MLIHSVEMWQVWRWWANMLFIYVLIVKQPAYTALFTFVVTADGRMTMTVY